MEAPETMISSVWEEHAESEKYQLLEISSKLTREQTWKTFSAWAKSRNLKTLESLTPSECLAFLDSRGTKNKTYNNRRNDLRQTFMSICFAHQKPNPFDAVPQKTILRGEKKSEKYRAFTQTEIKNILEAVAASNMRDRSEWLAACQIALQTGLRFKDVAFLQWDSVRADCLELVPFKTANRTDRKAVLIKKTPCLKKILASLPHKNEFVLPGLAAAYNVHNSSLPFMRILKALGIKSNPQEGKAGFHSFRTTVVTLADRAGVDLKELGGVLGHSSEGQTQHYNRNASKIDLSFLPATKLVADLSKKR